MQSEFEMKLFYPKLKWSSLLGILLIGISGGSAVFAKGEASRIITNSTKNISNLNSNISNISSINSVINLSSPWEIEFGPRFWYSLGSYQKSLYSSSTVRLNSILTYSNISGLSAEGFWKFAHRNGLFLKGYVGGGSLINGHMNDEDFFFDSPYSNTYHTQKNGNINYFNADIGYQWDTKFDSKIGVFIGYHYWNEYLNTFGCDQTATSTMCSRTWNANISEQVNGLNNVAALSSLRIGVAGEIDLSDTLFLSSDLAYVRSFIGANDFHNQRPEIRNLREEGKGYGFQVESALNWKLSEALHLAIAGRWWNSSMQGFARFEQTAVANGGPNAMNFNINRYGLFLETKYKPKDLLFNPLFLKSAENIFYWPGLYGGVNVGYGVSPRTIFIRSLEPTSQIIRQIPKNLNVREAGFLGGGQFGYNYALSDDIILGLEADINYTKLAGTNGINSNVVELVNIRGESLLDENRYNTTVNKELNWLATFRPRIGKLVSENTLLYLTGGPALGRAKLDFYQEHMDGALPSLKRALSSGTRTQNKFGWIAGTGLEYAIDSSLSFKAEYLYTALGKVNLRAQDNGIFRDKIYSVTSNFNYNLLRFGVNYKF